MIRSNGRGGAGTPNLLRVAGVGLCLWAAACGDEKDGDPAQSSDRVGLEMCCDLGDRCHPGPEDAIGGPVRGCHNLGHQNDPAACREQYDDCLAACGGDRAAAGDGPHSCL